MFGVLPLLFFLCLLVLSCNPATSLKYMAVEGKAEIPASPGGGPIGANGIRVTLNGEKYTALTRLDGTFTFPFVPSGIYLVDVLSIHDVFPQMKIQVNAEEGIIKVVEYKYPGAVKRPSTYPLLLTAMAPINYFQARPQFSIMGFVMANPMIILMGFSALLLVGMPKILKELDPEALKEYEEAQRNSNPQELLSKLLGK